MRCDRARTLRGTTDRLLGRLPRRPAPVLVALLALVAACGGEDRAPGPSQPARSGQAQDSALCRAGTHGLPAATGGLLHVPAAGGRRPLVLAFHGAGGTAEGVQAYFRLDRVADREGFLVAYPQASRNRFWELRPEQRNDIGSTRALLARLRALPCVDPDRIYATGVSNGGGFSARLACAASDVVAAVVPVAGSYRALGPCRPVRPVPVLEVHGTADTVVPYRGSVAPFLAGWVARDGCDRAARVTRPRALVERRSWANCRDGARVEHLRLGRTTHGWPRSVPTDTARPDRRRPGPDVTGLDTASVAWSFLRGFRR